ncbi:MAG: hypothetical protein EOO46_18310 [Flavobacterium sp.]|nr:MAG: hypothetical protein EOO46_18310 [Flavobacterium sp.]
MKKSSTLTLLLVLFLSLLSCKKETPLEFEKKVMCEILPSLMDSLAIDRRLMYPPPFSKAIFDKNDNLIGLDSSDLEIRRKEYDMEVLRIRKDTNVVFLIKDSVHGLNQLDWSNRNEYFKDVNFEKDSLFSKLNYKIDLGCTSKYKLKYLSQFKGYTELFDLEYEYEIGGILSFSKIYFDKERKHGILSGSYLCGGKFGRGYNIYLKKINDKWVIQKIIPTWIA